MLDCVFCKLIKKEIPSLSVYETEGTLAFLEHMPSAPGHTMVIHKRHGNNIQEYSEKELGAIMESVKVVSQKIEKALQTDSISIGINHKEKKGAPHLHIHLIPRWKNDKGGIIQSLVKNKSAESREAIAERIKKH